MKKVMALFHSMFSETGPDVSALSVDASQPDGAIDISQLTQEERISIYTNLILQGASVGADFYDDEKPLNNF